MAPDDSSREAIMSATFDALCEHGYANLTMQSIADEFDKSKSLIHYHYDSKDDLLAAFMDHLLENFVEMVTGCGGQDPVEELRRMADIVVVGADDGNDANDFHTALLGLRAQAPYDEKLRDQLARNDARIRELIADIVRDGQEQGQFDESVDPEEFAALFRSAIEGAQAHGVVLGDAAPTDEVMAAVDDLLVDRLLVGEEGGE
ncbi:TetR/AcrR family transcriptional regulator [Halobacteria archaeon HArc-gm2]|nr:TetR/AcrR family transcriptional regulator [Halobacteria archaeon HArc-gm2]